MNKRLIRSLGMTSGLTLTTLSLLVQADIKTLNTQHFQFHFEEALTSQAQKAASAAENVYPRIIKKLDWTPKQTIHVHLKDSSDETNGWAKVSPRLQIQILTTPPDSLNTPEDIDEFYAMILEHELTHIVHLDMTRGAPKSVQNWLGNNPLFYPNLFQPTWLIEGMAVYLESHKTEDDSIGRGFSSLYRLMMREEVKNGLRSYQNVNADYQEWPFGKQYLYGAFFHQYLAQRYGERKMMQLPKHYSNNLIPFLLNHNAKQTFGQNFPQLWQSFEKWLHQIFDDEIAQLNQKQSPSVALELPAQPASPVATDGQNIYLTVQDGYHLVQLIQIDRTGQQALRTELKTAARSLSAHKKQGLLITQGKIYHNGDYFYDLYRLAPTDQSPVRLTTKARYKAACWLSDGSAIVAYRQQAGESQLDLLNNQGELQQVVWQGENNTTLSYLSCHPNQNTLFASMRKDNQPWQLVTANLETINPAQSKAPTATNLNWMTLPSIGQLSTQASVSSDGQYLLFSAEQDKQFNIYRLPLKDISNDNTEEHNPRSLSSKNREIEQISHSPAGAFTPMQLGSRLYYQQYSAQGYRWHSANADPLQKHMAQSAKQIPLQRSSDLPKIPLEDYSPWESLSPNYWMPLYNSVEEQNKLGLMTSGEDAAQQHFYQLSSLYDTQNKTVDLTLAYQYQQKLLLQFLQFNEYIEASNQHRFIEQQRSLEARLPYLFSSSNEHWYLGSGISWQKDSIARTLQGQALQLGPDFSTAGFDLNYRQENRYIYALPSTRLDHLHLLIESHLDNDYSGERGFAHYQLHRPMGTFNGQGLWDRALAGFSLGYYFADDTARAWSLGGDQVDFSTYGQDTLSLRGYNDHTQIGQSAYKVSASLKTPLQRDAQSWGMLPVAYTGIDMSLFSEIAAVESQDSLSNIGASIKAHFQLGYRLPLSTELGIAEGLNQGGKTDLFFRVTLLE